MVVHKSHEDYEFIHKVFFFSSIMTSGSFVSFIFPFSGLTCEENLFFFHDVIKNTSFITVRAVYIHI